MFTGLIQDIGRVQALSRGEELRAEIKIHDLPAAELVMGASIACDGCCLTVVDFGTDWFAVEISEETLSKTNLGQWAVGTQVNLESSLKLGDALGGHIVSGHVDGLAVLKNITPEGGSYNLRFEVPEAFAGYIAQKGSITLNGVSLTINKVQGNAFEVNIIPHTWQATNLSALQAGQSAHFEVDMLARYVARQMEIMK